MTSPVQPAGGTTPFPSSLTPAPLGPAACAPGVVSVAAGAEVASGLAPGARVECRQASANEGISPLALGLVPGNGVTPPLGRPVVGPNAAGTSMVRVPCRLALVNGTLLPFGNRPPDGARVVTSLEFGFPWGPARSLDMLAVVAHFAPPAAPGTHESLPGNVLAPILPSILADVADGDFEAHAPLRDLRARYGPLRAGEVRVEDTGELRVGITAHIDAKGRVVSELRDGERGWPCSWISFHPSSGFVSFAGRGVHVAPAVLAQLLQAVAAGLSTLEPYWRTSFDTLLTRGRAAATAAAISGELYGGPYVAVSAVLTASGAIADSQSGGSGTEIVGFIPSRSYGQDETVELVLVLANGMRVGWTSDLLALHPLVGRALANASSAPIDRREPIPLELFDWYEDRLTPAQVSDTPVVQTFQEGASTRVLVTVPSDFVSAPGSRSAAEQPRRSARVHLRLQGNDPVVVSQMTVRSPAFEQSSSNYVEQRTYADRLLERLDVTKIPADHRLRRLVEASFRSGVVSSRIDWHRVVLLKGALTREELAAIGVVLPTAVETTSRPLFLKVRWLLDPSGALMRGESSVVAGVVQGDRPLERLSDATALELSQALLERQRPDDVQNGPALAKLRRLLDARHAFVQGSEPPDAALAVVWRTARVSKQRVVELQSQLTETYGVPARRWLGWLDDARERTLVMATQRSALPEQGVSAALLYTIAIGEGLNAALDFGYIGMEDFGSLAPLDGFSALGVDHFASELDHLKALELLPADYVVDDHFVMAPNLNEKGEHVQSAVFLASSDGRSALENGMRALAAVVAERRRAILAYAGRRLGEEVVSRWTPAERNYVTYLAFNAGGRTASRFVDGIAPGESPLRRWTGSDAGGASTRMHYNAALRTATWALLDHLAIFGAPEQTDIRGARSGRAAEAGSTRVSPPPPAQADTAPQSNPQQVQGQVLPADF